MINPRTRALLPLVFFLILCGAVPLSAQEGVIRGKVRNEATGLPLSAVIEITGGGFSRSVQSDATGSYVLTDVAPGRWTVRARHLGFTGFEVEVVVPVGRELELDIVLRADPVMLEPLRVDAYELGRLADTLPAASADLGLTGARVLQGSPGFAEIGLTDAVRGPPGQEPIDPGDVLYVRGVGADMKLVYLDGAPVYAPFPLGGLVDPFTPELLQAADIYVGGAPARYDGGLSHVLDLRTRGVRSDRVHSSGAVDLLAARGMLEVPLGSRGGLLLAGRRVHGGGARLLAQEPLPYGYREGLLRGDLRVGRTGVVSLTAFRNGEQVWPGESGLPDSIISWGNTAVSLRYRGVWAGTVAELTAARGGFDARLPISGERPLLIEGSAERSRFAADFTRRLDLGVLRYGASFDSHLQGYVRHALASGERAEASATAEVLGAYGDLGWQIGPRFRLQGGMRADYFSLNSTVAFAPRLSASWLLTESVALTLAGGRYHQYLRPTETGLLSGDLGAATGDAPDALSLGRASHLALALAQDLGDGINFGVEGFFKTFDGVPGEEPGAANASGVDVWIARDVGRLTGWAGYSLAWIWSEPDQNQHTRFAGRHLLTTGLGFPLGGGKVGMGFTYGAGLPYSAIPVSPTQSFLPGFMANDVSALRESSAGAAPLLPADPIRPYLRLDLSASRTWTPRFGVRSMEITPYVRVLNSLGQRDALFYRYDRDRDTAPRPLAVIPTVPVLGLEWRW